MNPESPQCREPLDVVEPDEPTRSTLRGRLIDALLMPSLYSIFITAVLVYIFPWPLQWMTPVLCGDGDLVIGDIGVVDGYHARDWAMEAQCVGEVGERAVSLFSVFALQYPVTLLVVAMTVLAFQRRPDRTTGAEAGANSAQPDPSVSLQP